VEAARVLFHEQGGEGSAEAAEVFADKAASGALDRREPLPRLFLVLARPQGAQPNWRPLSAQE
jgi:hypothetical protein